MRDISVFFFPSENSVNVKHYHIANPESLGHPMFNNQTNFEDHCIS